INVAFRFLGVIFLLLLIRAPADGWKVLLIYSTTTLLAHGVNYRQLYQEIEFRWPTKKEIAESLHQGFAMFLVRIPGSILSVANSFVLGLLSGPVVVGYYSGADRIVRPVV